MDIAAPSTVAERFGFIMAWLRRAVMARRVSPRELGPVIMLIANRLSRIAARFATLAEQARGDTLPAPRRRGARGAPAAVVASPARIRLPGGNAWLVRLVPEARVFGSQLRHLLADPEMAAMLAAAPGMGRLLRPLCRMLGVEPMPELLARPTAAPIAAASAAADISLQDRSASSRRCLALPAPMPADLELQEASMRILPTPA